MQSRWTSPLFPPPSCLVPLWVDSGSGACLLSRFTHKQSLRRRSSCCSQTLVTASLSVASCSWVTPLCAGFGKSAISVELFERQLHAFGFGRLARVICSYTDNQTLSVRNLIRSIAFQCRQNVPSFAASFSSAQSRLLRFDALDAKSDATAADLLANAFVDAVLIPLSKCPELKEKVLCLVVDSLDESLLATADDSKDDAKGAIATVADLLCHPLVLAAVPARVRIIATSRKQPTVTERSPLLLTFST
jgi:hypothetical protein